MDEQAKKTTLRMIPYGLYVLGTKDGEQLGASTINWVTQTSFAPPLIAMGVKKDSGSYAQLKANPNFALSFLGTGQKDVAFAFFKATEQSENTLNGQEFEAASNGAPIISSAPAWVEGRVVGEIDTGDHSCVVTEVTNAGLKQDNPLVLTLDEVGVKYGG